MTRVEGPRGARRGGGDLEAGLVELEDHGLRVEAGDHDAHDARQAVARVGRGDDPGPRGAESPTEPLGARGDEGAGLGQGPAAGARRGREGEGAAHVLGPRAPASLLAAAEGERAQRGASAARERAHADGTPELVGGHAHGVHVSELERNVPEGLDRVGVEERPGGVRRTRELGDGHDDAGLVVRVHDRDEGARVVEKRGEGLGPDHARAVGTDELDLEAPVAKRPDEVEDRVVLNGGEDNAPAAGVTHADALRQPEDREVVGLGSARGEGDLGGAEAAAEAASDVGAGLV